VAAVFDAFLGIYSARVQDLRRIATGGTGILPQGDIHPDLANRFADEAVKTAQRVLTICIRALDYLPPVDITFGDYLRALITADVELVPDDPQRYRVAFIEAFRKRGIFPFDVRAMGEDTLRWKRQESPESKGIETFMPPPKILRTMAAAWEFSPEPMLDDETKDRMWTAKRHGDPDKLCKLFLDAYWGRKAQSQRKDTTDQVEPREDLYNTSQQFASFIYMWLAAATWNADSKLRHAAANEFGLDFNLFLKYLNRRERGAAIEVHDVRPTVRVHPDGRTKLELLVILTQRIMKPLNDEDGKPVLDADDKPANYRFRGGCTLLIDPEDGRIRYAIAKRITSEGRREKIEQFLRERVADLGDAAFNQFRLRQSNGRLLEPLAILHRNFDYGAC
jgi:hypothetical protein